MNEELQELKQLEELEGFVSLVEKEAFLNTFKATRSRYVEKMGDSSITQQERIVLSYSLVALKDIESTMRSRLNCAQIKYSTEDKKGAFASLLNRITNALKKIEE